MYRELDTLFELNMADRWLSRKDTLVGKPKRMSNSKEGSKTFFLRGKMVFINSLVTRGVL